MGNTQSCKCSSCCLQWNKSSSELVELCKMHPHIYRKAWWPRPELFLPDNWLLWGSFYQPTSHNYRDGHFSILWMCPTVPSLHFYSKSGGIWHLLWSISIQISLSANLFSVFKMSTILLNFCLQSEEGEVETSCCHSRDQGAALSFVLISSLTSHHIQVLWLIEMFTIETLYL